VVDGEDSLLTGNLQPREGRTVYELIAESGAPRLLLERYAGRLEYHTPWQGGREFTHLMRGLVDAEEANALLAANGHDDLRLVDNGAIAPKPSLADLDGPPHAYHLMPRSASKANAVEAHMRARAYAPDECIAVGDSREDLGVAAVVGRFFLVANAVEKDPSLARPPNAEVTEARNGEGFYEAVVRSLAESRGG
jgi:hydroxymethylpyrimidine pyrophosphatase-like HAD family hydrolase